MTTPVKTLRGYRPLLFVPGGILFSRGYTLYRSDYGCAHLEPIARVPAPRSMRVAGSVRVAARLLRAGVTLACALGENECIVAEKRRLWRVGLADGKVALDHEVQRGSRPLSTSRISGVPGF